jgi:hypothetical protein
MDDDLDYIKKGSRCSSVVREVTVLGLLFTDDVAVGFFAING